MKAHPPRHGQLNGYPRDTDSWPLCRYCGARCPGKRNTFCGPRCVHEWKIRSSAAYARQAVKERDGGVCAQCGLDTFELWDQLRRMRLGVMDRDPDIRRAAFQALQTRLAELAGQGFSRLRSHHPAHHVDYGWLWQADHIKPVEHGGGMAGLDNLQTLCTPCHKRKTAEQARQRRTAK